RQAFTAERLQQPRFGRIYDDLRMSSGKESAERDNTRGAQSMKDLTSILVVLDRSARDTLLLAKALVLARELNARIELFSCDSEHAYAPQHADERGGIGLARQNAIADGYDYLRRLSHLVTAQNIAVAIEVVCESPLYEGIVHKVFKSCPDLVMKAAASEGSA